MYLCLNALDVRICYVWPNVMERHMCVGDGLMAGLEWLRNEMNKDEVALKKQSLLDNQPLASLSPPTYTIPTIQTFAPLYPPPSSPSLSRPTPTLITASLAKTIPSTGSTGQASMKVSLC
jgi:hypothetical protein